MLPNEIPPINELKEDIISIPINNSRVRFAKKSDDGVCRNKKIFEVIDKSVLNKICYICGETFYSKFNRDRHIDIIHFKSKLIQCNICHESYQDIEKYMKTCPSRKIKGIINNALNDNDNKTQKIINNSHLTKNSKNISE